MQYKNKFGTIQVMDDKELFKRKTLGVSMSGGIDSTMLCYLLAMTSERTNLEITIQPYNGLDLWAPIDSSGVIDIIQYIQRKFPTVDIRWPISTVFNTNGDRIKDKNTYIRPLIEALHQHNVVDLVMNGISMGPPLDVQTSLFELNQGPITRLPGHHLWNEVERAQDHLSPFKYVDKRFIVECYKHYKIKHLLKMTNSCTAPQGNCGECWWCQERAWAISEVFNRK